VLASGVIGIFLLTAFFGRAWCGWACPQTVYLEFLFRPIGRWFDHGYSGARNLDAQHKWWTPRRIAKYVTFFLLALFVSHTMLAFFVGTTDLYRWMTHSPAEHPTAFLLVTLFTGAVWFNFTYFREQTCLIVCPYGRWQAALIDTQSVIVGYDYSRGEPRELGTKNRSALAGDCIDCGACVQTCPTGIDIRNGLQMECVHCTQCIDACDSIMEKVGKPKGLIRYSSQDALAGKARKLLRLRTVLYPAVLIILLGGLTAAMILKAPADITVLRGLDGPFTEEADGRISNQIRVKITNRRGVAEQYRIVVEHAGSPVVAASDFVVVVPENPMSIEAGATRETSIFVLLPRTAFENGQRMIQLRVTDNEGYSDNESFRLLSPTRTPAKP
ncbi:MAG: cytochrome c oxidase accessory protein CcoG, partial [Gemmatimonadaceae bacterium]